jgi:ABC-type multidrug transport system ATPase subunit
MAMNLTWENLRVDIKDNRVLDDISGAVPAGSMVAVLGATGCGKSTLLNALQNKISHEGDVKFGGMSWSPELKRHIGFVEQDDIVISALTVRESLEYLVRFRVKDREEGRRQVDNVIKKMRLEKCADTRIGDQLCRGVSGGERKRYCIARELLFAPQVLMLDEPTSGLDATMARILIDCLRDLCVEQGLAVLSTIHQPSQTIFESFDYVIILDGGNIVYYGPPKEVRSFFKEHELPCPEDQGSAEFLLDVVVLDQLADKREVITADSRKVAETHAAQVKEKSEKIDLGDTYKVSWFTQVWVLTARMNKLGVAQTFTINNCILFLAQALLTSLLYLNLKDTEANVKARAAWTLWAVGTWMFFSISKCIPRFGHL